MKRVRSRFFLSLPLIAALPALFAAGPIAPAPIAPAPFAAPVAQPAAVAGVPFYYGQPTAYEAQISTVSTGIINDMQAVVSADERYVTINARPQSSTLLALQQFQFASGAASGVGFVGGIQFQKPQTAAGQQTKAHPGQFPLPGVAPAPTAPAAPAPSSEAPTHVLNAPVVFNGSNGLSILMQRGMTRVEVR